MKLMPCPLNGPRSITEFVYGGSVMDALDPAGEDDAAWADHIFGPHTPPGIVREWWCHVASGYWFIAERNTVTDEILRTFPPPRRAKPDEGAG